MDRRAAKELMHIDGWLHRVAGIVARGKAAYLGDDLLQEAGDSLMMKLGEAAKSAVATGRPGTGGRGLGASGGKPELHHSPVRRDQPRTNLVDAR
jgi:hypothetical protein